MTLVFSGICSHGPGITGRADLAPPELRDPFYAAYRKMGDAICATGAEALIVIAAEHFANFFMNNMPAYAIGMADQYEGPIEDPDWLRIPRQQVRGDADLSRRLIAEVQQTVDVAYAEEWKFDHGIMVPLHFLDPANALTIIPATHPAPPRLRLRPRVAPRRRCGAATHRFGRHRGHLALAVHPRQRTDQRGVGPRLPRSLGLGRRGAADRVHRRRNLCRRRPGRL